MSRLIGYLALLTAAALLFIDAIIIG